MHRFVKFADEEAAKNSIVEVNGKYFQGARLSVRGPEPKLMHAGVHLPVTPWLLSFLPSQVTKGACWGGVSRYARY